MSEGDVKKAQILNIELEDSVKLSSDDDDEKMSDESDEDDKGKSIETAQQILREHVEPIGTFLHLFWTTN